MSEIFGLRREMLWDGLGILALLRLRWTTAKSWASTSASVSPIIKLRRCWEFHARPVSNVRYARRHRATCSTISQDGAVLGGALLTKCGTSTGWLPPRMQWADRWF